jgi:hypothetical protein
LEELEDRKIGIKAKAMEGAAAPYIPQGICVLESPQPLKGEELKIGEIDVGLFVKKELWQG